MPNFDLSLYLVIGPENCGDTSQGRSIDDIVQAACENGVTLIQYRNKHASEEVQIEDVQRLLKITTHYAVPLLVNDKITVAQKAKAQGVHLGQSDQSVEEARAVLGPEAIIGLTVKNEAHVKAAPFEKIDYLGIGGVFHTQSKENPDTPLGLDGLKELVTLNKNCGALPAAAIAGIDESNCADVISCGVEGVAVISAICAAPSPAKATQNLHHHIQLAKKQRN